ncbi:MAG: hypothetical protein HEQ39_13500 [Rhizobacter sp.]
MAVHDLNKRFGGIRFPDHREPPPGPLAQLRAAWAKEAAPPVLSVRAKKMLSDLSPRIKTKVLQHHYAHVLERLAAVWQDPRSLRDLFDDFIFEGPSGRSGLSFAAIVELTELKEFCMRVRFSERPSIWDEALGLV